MQFLDSLHMTSASTEKNDKSVTELSGDSLLRRDLHFFFSFFFP